ncbi:hypothetical protein C3486_36210 [Streptomyces sp. Ru73]|uniref:hypothetical protein n=1 Tax=Streptomyces sp. Ru73 TaxID=2080748 RepID=UPI000CDE0FB8|nr:hypothetical protein [Streptomyces sp. Ru73]POX35935.1 hypothetical protein C3486_36210 [Streptomyces sp. Ru73]
MEAVVTSVVAVVGTLLGAGTTHFFQRRETERSHALARAEKLRQERIDAYCAYAGALLDYRRVVVHRWFVLHEDDGARCDEDTPELREEQYKTRTAAQEAMFRAQMVSDDPGIVERTERMLDDVTQLHWVEGLEEFTALRARTRQAIRDFVSAAARRVR